MQRLSTKVFHVNFRVKVYPDYEENQSTLYPSFILSFHFEFINEPKLKMALKTNIVSLRTMRHVFTKLVQLLLYACINTCLYFNSSIIQAYFVVNNRRELILLNSDMLIDRHKVTKLCLNIQGFV